MTPSSPSTHRRARRAVVVAVAALLLALSNLLAVPAPAPGQAGPIDPDTMLAEQALRSWQVIDLQPPAGSTLPDWDVMVWDFAELNGVMYVGGRFRKVRRYSGAIEHDQAYLAAFDVATGEWISSFRPTLDDGVYALAVSPDGSRLLVGGEFSNVNGVPLTSGIAALDPFTGAPDPNWKASITRDVGDMMVKDIEVSGGDVYVGGRFSHVENPGAGPVRRYSLAKLDGADGSLDTGWDVPVNGGRIMGMGITPDGEELYIGGFFSTVGQTAGTKWMAGIETADGTVLPLADPLPQTGNWYVFDVTASDTKIFGGTEKHRLFIWERETRTETHEYFAAGFGGDYQTLLIGSTSDQAIVGGQPAPVRPVLWAGGHHHGWEQRVGVGHRTQVLWLSAFDAETGERVIGWVPRVGMRDGVFALAQDSEGKLWVGGDPSSSATVPASGFVVFPHRSPDDEVNLARNASVQQSSTGESGITWQGKTSEERCDNARNDLVGPPGAAVDGKIAGGAGECSFTVTETETEPWWQVDLGQVGEIDAIRIWNMFSSGVPEDLRDVWIAIADDASAIDSTDPVALAADPDVTLTQIPGQLAWYHEEPIGVMGRHVRVFLNNPAGVKLRLPEVEVLDLPDVSPPPPIDPDETLVAKGSVWRYLDDGSNPGSAWNTPGFDDAAWGSGPALLGFGDGDIATVTAPGSITTYLRHEFDVSDPAGIAGLSLDLLADDGAVAYLNGTELHRLRMPAGPIGPSTPAADTVWGAAERAWTTVQVPSAALVAGTNVLAVEVHNNWSGGGDLAGDASLSIIDDVVEPPPMDQQLVALDGTWRYLDTGVDPGGGWVDPTFDDGAWSTGPAQLGYGDGDEATVIDEGPAPNRHITSWFRTDFELDDPADVDHLDVAIIRDDGAVVYINGTEVVRTNMPAGPISATTLASDYAWGPGEQEPQLFSVPADSLVAGTNVVAVEIHSASPGSRDLSFALEVIGVAP